MYIGNYNRFVMGALCIASFVLMLVGKTDLAILALLWAIFIKCR